MTRRPALRGAVDPFLVMEVMQAARERAEAGHDVLHLEVGQPSTGAPGAVVAAAIAALGSGGALGYTDAAGLPALREAIATDYLDRHGIDVDPSRVVVTAGASGACVLAILAAFDVGDRVAVTEPGYPCYRQILSALGCDVVGVPVDGSTRFQPTPDLLDACADDLGRPLDGLVIASPSNPCGTALDADELSGLVRWSEGRGVRLIADEIYHGISYGGPVPTAAGRDSGAVVVNSFSKYYSMTGWRLGWLVLPDDLVRPVERLAQNLYICPPTLSQHAALAAFDATEELEGHVARYRANRGVVLGGLEAMGCARIAPADGAFYAWAHVGHLTDDSTSLCRRWLHELGVAVTPGLDFDPRRGRDWVRISYAGSTSDVATAMDRLVDSVSPRSRAR